MDKRIMFRGLEHSGLIEDHINEQLAKVEEILAGEPSPITLDVTVTSHDVHQHTKVVARVISPHYDCYASHEGPDVYAEINEVIDRLYTQLQRESKKVADHRKHGCGKHCKELLYKEINKESLEAHKANEQEEDEE